MPDTKDTAASSLALDERLPGLLQKAIEVTLRETFQVPLTLEAWTLGKAPLALESYVTCLIRMHEDNQECGAFILAFSRETLVNILKKNGVTDSSNPNYLDDAATEIANMIYGMVKTNLNKMGYRLQMEIPTAVHETNGITIYTNSEKMVQPFVADGHRGRLVVTQNS